MPLETTESVEQTTEVENQGAEQATQEASAPSSAREAVEQADAREQAKLTAESVADLNSFKKVKFEDKEYTPAELRKMLMMQSDYSKKTAEFSNKEKAWAQEAKYQSNLAVDLAHVKANPSLAAAFKAAYPEKYHSYLNLITAEQRAEAQANQAEAQGAQIPKEVQERLARIDQLEKKVNDYESQTNEQKVTAINAELDATFAVLEKKYPFADEEQVIAKAQALLEKDPTITLTKETWDTLFKGAHSRVENLVKTRQSQAIDKQKQANQTAAGSAPGGQTPIKSATKFKSLREAADAAKQSLGS